MFKAISKIGMALFILIGISLFPGSTTKNRTQMPMIIIHGMLCMIY